MPVCFGPLFQLAAVSDQRAAERNERGRKWQISDK